MGLASQSFQDWKDDMKDDMQLVSSFGPPLSFDEFGIGFPLGLEAGYFVNDRFSVAAAVSYQKGKSGMSYFDLSGSFSSDVELSLLAVTASLSWWVPGARGLYLRVDGGAGFGKAKTESHLMTYPDPSNDVDAYGDWDGTAPIAGLFAGYEWRSPERVVFFTRAGYRFENLGELDGSLSSPQQGSQSGPPFDNHGVPMETDFSGVQAVVGLGYVFGGRTAKPR